MKCTICGYKFPTFEWERELPFSEQIKNTDKKVRDHYVRDHQDLLIILSMYHSSGGKANAE